MTNFAGLPGADLVAQGLDDLRAGRVTLASLLVSVGSPRLASLGIDVPDPLPGPEHALYALLAEQHGDDAHSQYNALIRRLVSFERALECESH